jgi:Xaa-Pro aminopeptidase
MYASTLAIPRAEFESRAEVLLGHLKSSKLSGVVLFDRDYVLYYTGFAFIPTERPIAFVMNADGQKVLVVPRLEVEHAQAHALVDHVPLCRTDDPHPMYVLKGDCRVM